VQAELQLIQKQSFPTTKGAKSIEAALGRIFPSQKEETRLQKVRRIMGGEISILTDEEIISYITEFQFLVDAWLDEYELKAFRKTLNQLKKED